MASLRSKYLPLAKLTLYSSILSNIKENDSVFIFSFKLGRIDLSLLCGFFPTLKSNPLSMSLKIGATSSPTPTKPQNNRSLWA